MQPYTRDLSSAGLSPLAHARRLMLGLALASSSLPAWSAPEFQAQITRTEMGIPHIKAPDLQGAGYGYGYTFAEDNLCTFFEALVTVRGQRSKYFGPDASIVIAAVPVTAKNIDADFFYRLMATPSAIAKVRSGAKPEVQAMVRGYAAGVSRYVNELKSGMHPGRHAQCASAEYVAPITADDIYARIYQLTIVASTSVFITEIANASPPALSVGGALDLLNLGQLSTLLKDNPGPLAAFTPDKPMGSNAYALGPQATKNGENILFGNPHFPWTGSERLYMAHLTVPGVMDIQGASLYGAPLINIGFNDRLAWSHTVSSAYRFSMYQLLLNPLNPLEYLYDAEIRSIQAVPLTVEVKTANGVETRSRTLYRSHYGPMFTLNVMGLPVLGWDAVRAYTIRDANEDNNRLLNTFFEFNTAQTLAEFGIDQRRELGTPWVNTLATGPGQQAYYSDVSVVPNVPDEMVTLCQVPGIMQVIGTAAPGLPVLQGQRSDCEWRNDPDAPPGIFGPSNLPTLLRDDWTANHNDSFWLTNPAQPLEGFDRIIGAEREVQTLRTRLGIKQIQRRVAGTDGLPGQGFSLDSLKEVVLSGAIFSAELAKRDVTNKTCYTLGLVNIGPACSALRNWDNTASLDSRGEPLWREFWNLISPQAGIWLRPFNPDDPVNTPNTLSAYDLRVRAALQDAQQLLIDNGVALDARLGDVQSSSAHLGAPIPVFGSEGSIGAFTVADSPSIEPGGYKVDYGNSYIQAVTWVDGKVHAEGFITYSQSTDPASPHYRDFTERYAAKDWLRFSFTDAEINASKISVRTIVSPN